MPVQPHQVQINVRVRLPKPHACGGNTWVVTRIGVDVRVRCCQCERTVMLPRTQFERRAQIIVEPNHE
ncbi:MAG: DUF951 domain-containing protein [Chloroflexi bacterium]|nr:DUF951 domain-containing protein [Chloroflexota bacterium]